MSPNDHPSDDEGWPPPGADSELYKAKLDVRKMRAEEEIARSKALLTTRQAVEEEYYKAMLEVSKGSVERARESAKFVETAAAAIGVIYASVLALTFSVEDNPLTAPGMIAAFFLGLAIALSTAFLAFLQKPVLGQESAGMEGVQHSDQLMLLFIDWSSRGSLRRASILRASVVALAAAVVFLPAPFVTLGPVTSSEPTATGASTSSAPTAAMSAEPIPWPSASAAGSEALPVKLRQILYTAQVQEVSALRLKAAATSVGKETRAWWNDWWFVLSGVALIVVVVVALWGVRRPGSDEGRKDAGRTGMGGGEPEGGRT